MCVCVCVLRGGRVYRERGQGIRGRAEGGGGGGVVTGSAGRRDQQRPTRSQSTH